MGSYLSLTSRLSIIFSLTMLAIWGLVSLVLMQSLEQHFARQDEEDLRGKMILVKNLLSARLEDGPSDWRRLESQLQNALSGYGDHFLQIRSLQGQMLADTRATPSPLPALASDSALPFNESWVTGGVRYRSITERLSLPAPVSGQSGPVLVQVVVNTRYHQHFLDEIHMALLWLTAGIALISVLLGWLASHSGLKPLRSLARLSTQVTASKLDHRLPLSKAPAELHGPIRAFNDMLDRLEDSFQRLTTFSSDIAHELRTPVNSLLLQTQVALSQTRTAGDYREALYANLEAAERLGRMINEMLFLAKSDQGQLAMQCEPLDLADEVDELIEFFEPLASEQQVRLNRQGQARMQGDRAMLQRAISNLLTNAIRYTPPRREVHIRLKTDEAGASLVVANPGPAIPREEWPRLFDRFYRADHARQTVTEGTGLGLAIARAIVTSHGGTLSVHSDPRETCFTMHFPASPQQPA
ncbi:heavy metal sensor histidine kinase [Oceanimonas sp. CHS3-5]|uniref:heavy metal sensor histidine kinase n=1 Tax=Oceanimonas sp. CHS3-5 TaxID=3068186 RepID=UPI00273DA6F0|nr:heavy metal sensor histidine kinase [Oceanimonas sp. CHS3-5]MDP5291255.1 heavy metal sensor histidine kinase [Oceanimonas sp. CHS3-5]